MCAAFASVVIALAVSTSPAFAAEETHVFDATLSLTGNCETSKLDPVPDPSCPTEAPYGAFAFPLGVTTDPYGDEYYFGLPGFNDPRRLYVFSASGRFLTEVPESTVAELRSVAVDGEGDLYMATYNSSIYKTELFVLKPTVYDPQKDEIAYGENPSKVSLGSFYLDAFGAMAVEQATGRVFVVLKEPEGEQQKRIGEISSYAEGNSLLRVFGSDLPGGNYNLALDAKTKRIYVSEKLPSENGAYPSGIKVLDFAGNLLETMTGLKTTEGFHEFNAPFGQLGVAVDESTGHLFVSDLQNNPNPSVYEVSATGEPISIIRHSFQAPNGSDVIVIDNGIHSPNSAMNPLSPISEEENPNGSYLFVPSGEGGTGHLYAFQPKPRPKPPAIAGESFSGVGYAETVLSATVNPKGLTTEYEFEYVPEATFERSVKEDGAAHGFDHAVSGGGGQLAAYSEGLGVSVRIGGLQAGTAYRFRVRASNACEGASAPKCESDGEGVEFSTYPQLNAVLGFCPNQATRVGASALLPDCRAYELVTPTDTNGRAPLSPGENSAGPKFGTPPASASGEAVGFITRGGALPGFSGAGSFNGDPYVATRTSAGWRTESVGPSGSLSTNPNPGGFSPDLRYVAWYTGPEDFGSLAVAFGTDYVRYPDGSQRMVGTGSIGTDPQATPLLISAGGSHIVFDTAMFGSQEANQLEPDAPPTGTAAIYDRTADGVLHVISLLPGDVTPGAGENASYEGASQDGSVVAFKIGASLTVSSRPLYLRIADSKTVQATGPGATFEGLSASGRYLFFLQGGDLYRYDTQAEATVRVTETGDVTVVNIPVDGTGAYFSSPSIITSAGKNPNGTEAVANEANLYYWDGTQVHFVATLTKRDMLGEFTGGGGGTRDALGLWESSISSGSTAVDPSRTTPDGGTMVFESNADLTGYESGGTAEIYRYDGAADTLACVSCVPTRAPAGGDARLQTVSFTGYGEPTNAESIVPNLSSDGRRVFFETPDALVPADTDGVRDVYEWEADGEGSCATVSGCVFLISSGQSAHDNYLYGVSESGNDVFIYTSDLLTLEDGAETPSVYDARADGGFPPPPSGADECLGEACQPAPASLIDETPSSLSFEATGNLKNGPRPRVHYCHGSAERGHVGRHVRRHRATAKLQPNKRMKPTQRCARPPGKRAPEIRRHRKSRSRRRRAQRGHSSVRRGR